MRISEHASGMYEFENMIVYIKTCEIYASSHHEIVQITYQLSFQILKYQENFKRTLSKMNNQAAWLKASKAPLEVSPAPYTLPDVNEVIIKNAAVGLTVGMFTLKNYSQRLANLI